MKLLSKVILSLFMGAFNLALSAQGSMNFGVVDFSTLKLKEPDKDITFDPIEIDKPLSTDNAITAHVYLKLNNMNGRDVERLAPNGVSGTQKQLESIRGGVQIAVDEAMSNQTPKKKQQSSKQKQRSYYSPSPEFRAKRIAIAQEAARKAAEKERVKREEEQQQVNATTNAANFRMQFTTNRRVQQDIWNATEGAEKATNVGVDVANNQMQGVQFQNHHQKRTNPKANGNRLRENKNSSRQRSKQAPISPGKQINGTNKQYPVINRAQPNANGDYVLSGRPTNSAIFIMTDNGKVFTGEETLREVKMVNGAEAYSDYGSADDGLGKDNQSSVHIKKDARIVGHYNANGPGYSTSDRKGFVLDPNAVVTTGQEWRSDDFNMGETLIEFENKTKEIEKKREKKENKDKTDKKSENKGFTKEELDELLDDKWNSNGTSNGWYY